MSSGQTGADGHFKKKIYYHLKLDPSNWCGYFKGPCDMYLNIGEKYCWVCKYKKPLDIPELLVEKGRS